MKTGKKAFAEVLNTIEFTTKGKGYRLTELLGTKLYGQVTGRGKDAWFHEVYSPLDKQVIEQLENDVGRKIPSVLKEFYSYANGLNLFSDELAIYGNRDTYKRSEYDLRLPYSIVTPNTEERPLNSIEDATYFGSYSFDGSMLFIDYNDGSITLCNRDDAKDVVYKWSDFWTFLTREAKRLQNFYDEQMQLIDDTVSTLPPNEFTTKRTM